MTMFDPPGSHDDDNFDRVDWKWVVIFFLSFAVLIMWLSK